MADTYSTESIDQAAERKGRRAWPQSLYSTCAIDDLSQQLYKQSMFYNGDQPKPWQDVPFNLRTGYFELAKRILDGLGAPSKTHVDDRLFSFASSVALAEAALVTGQPPRRTIVAGLPGKIVGMICAADVIDGRD